MPGNRPERAERASRRLKVVAPEARPAGVESQARPVAQAVPLGLPPFVGREREIALVLAAMANDRVITLTGPSGIGKTRLALEVADRMSPMYGDGAWLVELAPVSDPALVPATLASTLGLDPEPGRDPVDAACARMGTGACLVVLDNCEHVLDAAADLVERLLAGCPWARVVATSQRRLGTPAERTIAVTPLSLLAPGPFTSVEEAVSSEAVALFAARATAASPAFTLDEDVLPAVAEICARLDGIPLAIELAAARIATLGPADIADRLDERFRLLVDRRHVGEARHATLEAALDWSYDLLAADEATLLRRLAVFSGSAGLHAVEAVCAGPGLAQPDIVDLVASLVSRSLVLADTSRPRARYRLLQTVRAYATERLEQSGEAKVVRIRHAAWAASLAERAWHQVTPEDRLFWTAALEADHENLRAAMEWCVASRPDLALRLASALFPFWKNRGYFHEGVGWLRRSLDAAPDAPLGLRARGLFGLALLAMMRGDFDVARTAADESLALARQSSMPRAEANALNLAGFISIFTQDPVAAKPLLEESVRLARADGDPLTLVNSLALFGRAHMFLGEVTAARQVFEEALALAEAAGEESTGALIGLGWAHSAAGERARADAVLQRVLTFLRGLGERFETALVLSFMGSLAWRDGRLSDATTLLEESRTLAVAMGATFPLARCLTTMARVALAQDDAVAAGGLVEEAYRVAQDAHLPYALVRAVLVQGDLRRQTGDQAGAGAAYDRAGRLALANADAIGAAQARLRAARLARTAGRDQEAGTAVSEAIALLAGTGHHALLEALELMAAISTDQGKASMAAGLCGAAQAMRDDVGWVRAPEEAAAYEDDLARLRTLLGPDDLATAWHQGAVTPHDQVVALALRGRGGRERLTQGWDSLSPTEAQIADLVTDGLTNKEIGEKLFISARTVQSHLSRTFAKLGVASRRELRDARRRR